MDCENNTGYRNSGDNNSGHRNTGNSNSGDNNSGDMNSGNMNSGNMNSGYRNSGDNNPGHRNTGYWNSGDMNSGDMNSGDWNSGDWNSGNRNTGDNNSGHRNSGCWNSGDWNSGYLNSDRPTVRMFNKDTGKTYQEVDKLIPHFFYFENNEWVESKYMTTQEKEDNPEHETTGGFLRVKEYKQAWREAWDKANDEDRRKCLNLPNWDNKIFKEITGIDVEKELSASKETIKIGGHKYDKDEVEKRLKD